MILILQFLLVPDNTGRIAAFLFYILLSLLYGKKSGWARTAVVFLTIVLLNLFPPAGKVLLQIGRFGITEGPLRAGLVRAATFSGMFLLSGIAVRPGLNLPGKAGQFLSEVLGIFTALQTRKNEIRPSSLSESLDDLLISLSVSEDNPPPKTGKTSAGGILLIIILTAVNEGFLLFPFILEKLGILRLSV